MATSETQVTSIVRQLDAQGPAVVQRITSQVGNLACSPETVQNLVEALRSGTSVTLSSDVNGRTQSATFNPRGSRMGYGEAFIALSLAAEQLRNAGVTSCATPEQWKAVLLGGPLNVSQTSSGTNTYASSSASTTLPGIVTLRSQGQGWGQIAQRANVQLGQVIRSSGMSSADMMADPNAAGAPTGFSSRDFGQSQSSSTPSSSSTQSNVRGQDTTTPSDDSSRQQNWSTDKSKDRDRGEHSDTDEDDSSSSSDTGSADSTSGSTQPTR